jgi:hypothetical protein
MKSLFIRLLLNYMRQVSLVMLLDCWMIIKYFFFLSYQVYHNKTNIV